MKFSLTMPRDVDYLAAVKRNGLQLEGVPKAMRNETMCIAAVTSNGLALEMVPIKLRRPELCRLAVINNGLALQYVPMSLRTYDLCMRAYGQNKQSSKFYPDIFPKSNQAITVGPVFPTEKIIKFKHTIIAGLSIVGVALLYYYVFVIRGV